MKKILSALLLLVMCAAACVPALAETAQFSSTRSFLSLLDEADMKYTVRGIDEDGDEYVTVKVSDENTAYTIYYFFESDQEHTAIFVWNLIEFDPADTLKVMQVCNTLNYEYNYSCFYVDETDNTVTCSMNLIYRDDGVGLVVTEATLYLMEIIEVAYPSLAVYAK